MDIFTFADGDASRDYLVTLCMFALHKENIFDLLSPIEGCEYSIREHRSLGSFVEGIVELVVEDAQQLSVYLRQALAVRNVISRRLMSRS